MIIDYLKKRQLIILIIQQTVKTIINQRYKKLSRINQKEEKYLLEVKQQEK